MAHINGLKIVIIKVARVETAQICVRWRPIERERVQVSVRAGTSCPIRVINEKRFREFPNNTSRIIIIIIIITRSRIIIIISIIIVVVVVALAPPRAYINRPASAAPCSSRSDRVSGVVAVLARSDSKRTHLNALPNPKTAATMKSSHATVCFARPYDNVTLYTDRSLRYVWLLFFMGRTNSFSKKNY